MLLNALVHRNYMGSMTQLRVMDDRLSLWNAGTLPPELSVAELFQTHRSVPRNPLIAEVCYRIGYIDSWGRGIEKIIDACRHSGLPEPVIEENSGGVSVELLKAPVPIKVDLKSVEKTPVEARVKTPEAILQVLKEDGTLTLMEVANRIGKSVSAVERAAKKLKDQGRLIYVGPRKGGQWQVKE